MAGNKVDMIGKRFSRLLVLEEAGREYSGYLYKCRCDCGAVLTVRGASLRSGNTKSCGCLLREVRKPQAKR